MDDDLWMDGEIPIQRDRRAVEMGRYEAEPSVDISTALSERRLEAIHCRLLERATRGRLTWRGDEIVRTNRPRPTHHVEAGRCPQSAEAGGTGGFVPARAGFSCSEDGHMGDTHPRVAKASNRS